MGPPKFLTAKGAKTPNCLGNMTEAQSFRDSHEQHPQLRKRRNFWSSFKAAMSFDILCMDEVLHRFETMGNRCWLVFPGEYQFLHFLGGAGCRPSTVCTTRFPVQSHIPFQSAKRMRGHQHTMAQKATQHVARVRQIVAIVLPIWQALEVKRAHPMRVPCVAGFGIMICLGVSCLGICSGCQMSSANNPHERSSLRASPNEAPRKLKCRARKPAKLVVKVIEDEPAAKASRKCMFAVSVLPAKAPRKSPLQNTCPRK